VTRHRSFKSNEDSRRGLLLIVQLPPPVHGVTMMNEAVVRSTTVHSTFDVDVMPLRFAASVADVGRFNVKKVFLTGAVALRLMAKCIKRRPRAAYFTLVPVGMAYYRDIVFVAVLKLLRIPVIFHLHGRGVKDAARKRWKRWLNEWTFKGATVVHLSERLYEDIEQFVPRDKCHFLPNGIVDWRDALSTRPRDVPRPVPRLLFLSNMRAAKGALVVVEALRELRARGIPFEGLFVGDASDRECLQRFEALVTEAGMGDAVRYVGPKYGEEKMRIMAESDIFVFPSFQECLPLVILEAMSSSLPVVATGQGGIPDLVEDGVTGFLVPVGDSAAVADRLATLIQQPDLRVAMGEKGRERFLERFTLDKFDAGIGSIFEKVLQRDSVASRSAAEVELRRP